ncbi:MAG TPA: hypothetical protein DDZ76_11430 [Xanthomonadales bacterium]|nr:hypothetical protein [Xanthomonadales bacterium]
MANPVRRPLHARLLLAGSLSLVLATTASSQESTDPALADAERMPRAVKTLLTSVAQVGDGLVAVGERGHVLLSEDGLAWTQPEVVPTRSALTAVAVQNTSVWAVGHDGIILHSADAGRTWDRQRADPRPPDSFDPDQGRPLLDVLFVDEQRGWAIGAYSLLLETGDAGQTWRQRDLLALESTDEVIADPAAAGGAAAGQDDGEGEVSDGWLFNEDELELEAEENPHLNAIARTPGGRLLVAGERGAAFRSLDDGVTWERLQLPYEGSMFGVLTWGEERALLFGLRGNVLETHDFGATWQTVDSGTEASLMGGHALADGGAVLVGAEGRVVVRVNGDAAFEVTTYANEDGETPILADVLPQADGGYLVVGERGVGRHSPK